MNIVVATGARRSPAETLRDECDALRYEHSLLDFIGGFWPYIEPNSFQSNWHIEAICDHLEAAVDWQIKRGLLINMPPRHMKSLAANVFFPAWVWAQDPNTGIGGPHPFRIRRDSWRGPGTKFMHLSYANTLATRDGRKCRTIIVSPKYQQLWGHRVRLQPDQNQKTRFDNVAGGHRVSTSEGGTVTGEGADIIIFDDPHNVRAIGGTSAVAREKTLRFWDEAMPSRLNDQEHGVFVVIMQRVHERDLSGHILATEMGWTHLCLPAVYEANHPHPIRTSVVRKSTGEVWKDPRSEGEALWPAKYSVEALQRMTKGEGLSTHMAAGQYQQRPTAREGGLFKREWFGNPVKYPPEGLRLVRAWDLAASVESNADCTVGLLMGRHPETEVIYIIDVLRGRWSPAEVEIKIQSMARLDGEECEVVIPEDPGSAGKFQARYLVGKLQGYTVRTEAEVGAKEYRANPLAAQCEHGFVKLVEGAWNHAFVEELCAFPNAAHDDQVDAASAAFRGLTRRTTWSVA